jgi:hypothetical protein
MSNLKEKTQQLASRYFEDIVTLRRHLHSHPELSFEEYETSAFIKRELDTLGVSYETLANTGVVALIKGDKPSDYRSRGPQIWFSKSGSNACLWTRCAHFLIVRRCSDSPETES